jgi:aromatic-L-amino-acid decarboxylase
MRSREPTDVAECLVVTAEVLDGASRNRGTFAPTSAEPGLEVGVLADFCAAAFDINLASYAGAAYEIEAQATRWLGEFWATRAKGASSQAAALSRTSPRSWRPGSRRSPARSRDLDGCRLAAYTSTEAHCSVGRAVDAMGVGHEWLRTLPIDGERRLVPEALDEAVRRDRANGIVPLAVVATAGTTLTGAVDPLDAIADTLPHL